jgi:hypothetical protein
MTPQIQTLSKFIITNRQAIPVPSINPDRKMHVVCIVSSGFREFALLQDFANPDKIWLNEIIGSQLEEIVDDNLFKELWDYLCQERILLIYADEKEEAEKQGGIRK